MKKCQMDFLNSVNCNQGIIEYICKRTNAIIRVDAENKANAIKLVNPITKITILEYCKMCQILDKNITMGESQ